MKPITKILCPTDFSAGADAAAERALELALRLGANVTLFHAYLLPVPYPDGVTMTSDILTSIEASTRAALEAARDRLDRRGREIAGKELTTKIDVKLAIGAAAVAIIDEATAGAYDLVVIGTHGRTGLSHLLIGSVAERVVRAAPCPVLTVRGKPEAERHAA